LYRKKNNCAFEPSPLTGMELNVLDPETCIGKFCAGEVLNTICCGFQPYSQFRYSPAAMPPYCSTSSPALAVFLVLFFLCLGSIAVIAIIAITAAIAFYFLKMKPGSAGLNSVYSNTEKFENLE